MSIRLFFLLLGIFSAHPSPPSDIPFSPGEKLTFQVTWFSIPAGEAVLEILPFETIDEDRAFHFLMTARTYKGIDLFYKVRDRVDSYTDEKMTRSLHYKQRQDGRRKKAVTVDFDWEKKEAQYSNFGEKIQPVTIMPGTFDPLSIFYAFRLLPLEEGAEIQAAVTDGKKCVVGRAKALKRETISVRGTTYDTFLVEPNLEHVGGVFDRGRNAKVQMWVTADKARIPVRIKSELLLGSFVADLISVDLHS